MICAGDAIPDICLPMINSKSKPSKTISCHSLAKARRGGGFPYVFLMCTDTFFELIESEGGVFRKWDCE